MNRMRDQKDTNETTHVMKYIFPRQFGLHNAVTSKVDFKESSQPFKDYTLREKEIARLVYDKSQRHAFKSLSSSLPRRLRGQLELLIGRLRKRHARCPYSALLQSYCPPQAGASWHKDDTAPIYEGNVLDLATPPSRVSAYCRAVIEHVFPGKLWDGKGGNANKHAVMQHIDRFVKLGRYESMTLHDVLQDFKASPSSW